VTRCKSLRNTDAKARPYWPARLIEGGADPVFIARRLCILASEDVGLADPQAMVRAAAQIVGLIDRPARGALSARTGDGQPGPRPQVEHPDASLLRRHCGRHREGPRAGPAPPQKAVTRLMKSEGYGQGYRCVHDDPNANGEMSYLPGSLVGKVYINPDEPGGAQGTE
jgi:putative ATPase